MESLDFIKKYNFINWIEFNNLNFNFEENYFNEVNFMYNNINYSWKVIGGLDSKKLKLFESNKLNVSVVANRLLKHKDFDFFIFNNTKNKEIEVTKDNLFSELKLGILAYV